MKKSQKLLYEPLPLLMYGEKYYDNFNMLMCFATQIQHIIDNWRNDLYGELTFFKKFDYIHELSMQEMMQIVNEIQKCLDATVEKKQQNVYSNY